MNGWALDSLGYLDPPYTPIPSPKPSSTTQEDSGCKHRRTVVANNNNSPQFFSQSLASPTEQPNPRRCQLLVDNKDRSPQLFPLPPFSPHEQQNRKRRRSVADNDNDCSQLLSSFSANEQPNRKHPQRIFFGRDDHAVEAQRLGLGRDERKDDWLATSRTTSAVLRTTFGADLRASASSFNDLVPLKAVPQSPEATQNQPHNFAVNHIEAGTTAAERGKWYCTICHKGPFKGKPGWKKHEEKKHFPNFTAFCQPNIGMDGRIITCSICNVENPECRHFASCRGAECATKKLSDRKYLTKESFICHLQTEHLLPSHSPQVEEWQRTPPRHVWACGFCADWSINGIEDRFRHIARHYETDCTIADWKHSDVTYKLLYQPYILSEWFEQCRSRFAPQTHPGEWPDIFWSDDEAKALQERLTAGQEEDARKLAEDAFNASQIGKQMQWRQQHQQHQQHPQHQQHQQHQQLHLQLHHQYQYQQRQKHQQQQEHQKRQQQERDTLVLGISQQ